MAFEIAGLLGDLFGLGVSLGLAGGVLVRFSGRGGSNSLLNEGIRLLLLGSRARGGGIAAAVFGRTTQLGAPGLDLEALVHLLRLEGSWASPLSSSWTRLG